MKFLVSFEGVPKKYEDALEKMLRDDIAGYPARLSMESAEVEKHKEKPNGKSGQRKPARKSGKQAAEVPA